jgi:hypothetical protein
MATVTIPSGTIANASGDYDLVELVPATNRPIEIVGFVIAITSELGDAQEEFLAMSWVSDNTTSGNGSAATPRPVDSRDSVGFTAETVASTPASAGTPITIELFSVPSRGGDRVWYPDRCGPRIDAGDTALYLRLNVAVVDDLTLFGTVWVNEV